MDMCPSANILLIDDEVNLQRTLALILERAGYGVAIASCGRDALDILHQQAVDLVFLDIRMPDISGLDLLPQLRREAPALPVVMLTAYPNPETRTAALNLGARDFLVKPLDPVAILSTAKRFLTERSA